MDDSKVETDDDDCFVFSSSGMTFRRSVEKYRTFRKASDVSRSIVAVVVDQAGIVDEGTAGRFQNRRLLERMLLVVVWVRCGCCCCCFPRVRNDDDNDDNEEEAPRCLRK